MRAAAADSISGPKKDCIVAPLLPVSLVEDLVPPDHSYRNLEQMLDLGFVRELVQHAPAEGGRFSIDPVIIFKRQVVIFVKSLSSKQLLP